MLCELRRAQQLCLAPPPPLSLSRPHVYLFVLPAQDKRLEDVVRCNAIFTAQQDEQLVRWSFTVASAKSKDAVSLLPAELTLDPRAEMTYSFLKDIPAEDLRTRFATLMVFNMQLARCMDMIDMGSTDQRWSLGYVDIPISCVGVFASPLALFAA